MELVKDDKPHVGQGGVVLEPAKQDALGDKAQAAVRAQAILEAHLVAHLVPELAAAFPGDARGDRACGDAPGLQDDDAARPREAVVEEHLGHLCGLAGAGCGHEDETAVRSHGVQHLGMERPDGELTGIHWDGIQEGTTSVAVRVASVRRIKGAPGMDLPVFAQRTANTTIRRPITACPTTMGKTLRATSASGTAESAEAKSEAFERALIKPINPPAKRRPT